MSKRPEPTSSFGLTLRLIRQSAGLSLRKLAQNAGIAPSYLSQIESGRMTPPATETIAALAQALHIKADELLQLSGRVDSELSSYLAGYPEAQSVLEALRASEASVLDLSRFSETLRRRGLEWLRAVLDDAKSGVPDRGAVATHLEPAHILFNCEESNRGSLLRAMLEVLGFATPAQRSPKHPGLGSADEVLSSLEARELQGPTFVAEHVALPHASVPGLKSIRLAVARTSEPLIWAADRSVQIVVMSLHDPDDQDSRLRLLAELAGRLGSTERREAILAADSADQLYRLISAP